MGLDNKISSENGCDKRNICEKYALILKSSSKLSAGGKVDCTINTSRPLIFSSNDGWNSPSEKSVTTTFPN